MYRDCSKLTLDKFLDCLFDNELEVLIIEGKPTEEELKEAWDELYLQYCQLIQGDTYNEVFEIMKELNQLKAKVALTNGIVSLLQICYSKELVDILNQLGLKCDLKAEHIGSSLSHKLKAVVNRAKLWVVQIEKKEKDLEKLRAADKRKIDRNYFDDQLEALSSFNKYQVEASKITVSRYCLSINKLADHYNREQLNKK